MPTQRYVACDAGGYILSIVEAELSAAADQALRDRIAQSAAAVVVLGPTDPVPDPAAMRWDGAAFVPYTPPPIGP